jgi:hypothetical protein
MTVNCALFRFSVQDIVVVFVDLTQQISHSNLRCGHCHHLTKMMMVMMISPWTKMGLLC